MTCFYFNWPLCSIHFIEWSNNMFWYLKRLTRTKRNRNKIQKLPSIKDNPQKYFLRSKHVYVNSVLCHTHNGCTAGQDGIKWFTTTLKSSYLGGLGSDILILDPEPKIRFILLRLKKISNGDWWPFSTYSVGTRNKVEYFSTIRGLGHQKSPVCYISI